MTFNRISGMGCHDDDACDGGFRQVSEHYVDVVAPEREVPYPGLGDEPSPSDPGHPDWAHRSELNERHLRHQRAARAAARRSVFPCPNCNPEQFVRWQGNDWPSPRGEAAVAGLRRPSNTEPDAPPPPDDDDLFSSIAGDPERDGAR